MQDNLLINQSEKDKLFLDNNMRDVSLENGTQIKIFDSGNVQKAAILFVPMIKEVNLVYAPLIRYFSNEYRTIIYEPNLSTSKHFGIADRAKEIVSILNTLDIEKCHIVAWSDTCSSAYYLGKHYPNKCLSISFIGIADKYTLPQPYQFLISLLSNYPLEKIFPSNISAFLLSKCLGGNHINYKWLFNKAKIIPNFTGLLKFSVIPNLMEHLPNKDEMAVKSKIICGDNDFLASPISSSKMFQLLPNCHSIDIITNAEHFFVYINHQDVIISINNFLNSIK